MEGEECRVRRAKKVLCRGQSEEASLEISEVVKVRERQSDVDEIDFCVYR